MSRNTKKPTNRLPRSDAAPLAATMSPRDTLAYAACIAAGVLVLSLTWFKLSSLDLGYHIAYGRHFLDTGRIVGFAPDPFLLPETAIPFVNANWGSQVIMALAERLCGEAGLTALRTLLVATIFGAMAVVVRAMSGGPLSVATCWLLACLGAYERLSLRPELFSYAVMMLMLAILSRGVRSWKSAAAIALLQVTWVNLHSYFLVGVFLVGAYWLESLWRFIGRNAPRATDTPAKLAADFKRMTLLAALVVAACAAHPWGVRAAVFPLRTLDFLKSKDVMGAHAPGDSQSAWGEISEFKSPFEFISAKTDPRIKRVNYRTIQAYLAMLAVTAVAVVPLLRRGSLGAVVFILVLFAMSTQMRRNIAQFALAAAPMTVAAMASLRLSLSATDTKRVLVRRCLCAGVMLVCAALSAEAVTGSTYFAERRSTREFGYGYLDRTFPRAALAWLANRPDIQPNLFVDYFTSSNVLPWLPERFKLFVDTNTFAYEDATLRAAFDVGLGLIPHQPLFERFNINAALLHCGPDTQALVQALVRDDGAWALVYADPIAVIFVRRIPAHVETIINDAVSEDRADINAWIAAAAGPDAARAVTLDNMSAVPISLSWWRSAEEISDTAVRLRPDFEEAWINLGISRANLANASARAGRMEEAVRRIRSAIDCFERALAINPNSKLAAENLRRAKASLGGG